LTGEPTVKRTPLSQYEKTRTYNLNMQIIRLALFAGLCGSAAYSQDRVTIQAGTLLDGKGGVLHNQRIVVEGGRIISVGPGSGKADYDLTGLTVMPGWIDTHIHLNWHMDAGNKSVSGGAKPEEMALYTAADAWMTLQAGFTTVQSVGSAIDGPVRDRINDGVIPGPRVLTSLIQIQGTGGPGITPLGQWRFSDLWLDTVRP